MIQIKLSVKNLVEFIYRTGDLNAAYLSPERANVGSRLHRMIQKNGGSAYQSEVYLKETTQLDDSVCFVIDGRADGIITTADHIIIDEIKSVTCDEEAIHEDMNFTHWAQAYAYAYIYAKQHALESVIVQLTYVQIDSDHIKQFQREQTFAELEQFYLEMLTEYRKWAMRRQHFSEIRDLSIQNLAFPFPQYRPGQRELAIAVYKTILDEDILFAQAPTGIGKTISTLFPALKALREQKCERIFYLCAKNLTAKAAQDSVRLMMDQGLRIKCVSIMAKDKMCLLDERHCDPEICPYAKGYYNRLKAALAKLLDEYDAMDKECFQSIGRAYEVCPFELSLDASSYADLIICDYNYAFDPRVYLKRFFTEPQKHLLLIDEAHNMVDRARAMYSAQLSKSQFRTLYSLIDRDAKPLRRMIRKVIKHFDELAEQGNEHGFYADKEPCDSLLDLLDPLAQAIDRYRQKKGEIDEEILTIYFEILAFLRIADLYDDHFITWIKQDAHDITIKQFCMNPCRAVSQTLALGKGAVFFSATLTPIRYYHDLLLTKANQKNIALPSPFDPQKAKLLIHRGIDTRYRVRAASIKPICDTIAATVRQKVGNYIVFFPSYAYLNQVAEAFNTLYADIDIMIQESDMDDQQRRAFLAQFESHDQTMVCFCVLGGLFGEGIDFKGEALIGVIIVGVGLPQINEETDLLRDYFDQTYGKGYDYAYRIPGMNKVLQAAGRLIRDQEDYGVILLLDERYTGAAYRSLLPRHMSHYEVVDNDEELQKHLVEFWQHQTKQSSIGEDRH